MINPDIRVCPSPKASSRFVGPRWSTLVHTTRLIFCFHSVQTTTNWCGSNQACLYVVKWSLMESNLNYQGKKCKRTLSSYLYDFTAFLSQPSKVPMSSGVRRYNTELDGQTALVFTSPVSCKLRVFNFTSYLLSGQGKSYGRNGGSIGRLPTRLFLLFAWNSRLPITFTLDHIQLPIFASLRSPRCSSVAVFLAASWICHLPDLRAGFITAFASIVAARLYFPRGGHPLVVQMHRAPPADYRNPN